MPFVKTKASSSRKRGATSASSKKKESRSFLSRHALACFLLLIVLFGCASLLLNLHLSNKETKANWERVQAILMDSFSNGVSTITTAGGETVVDKSEEIHAQVNEEEPGGHKLAGLNCDAYGGPAQEAAQEMVYWEDIPSDARHISPFKRTSGPKQYLTFEPDQGGWNNIRMSMETVLAMAYAMGRTLVLPPEQVFYLLGKHRGNAGDSQRREFSFNHFFHMESIHKEHPGLDIITMKEFLQREAMTGNLRNQQGTVVFPPRNQTDWDGKPRQPLFEFLRATGHMAIWTPEKCMAAFPTSPDPRDAQKLWDIKAQVEAEHGGRFPTYEQYVGKPFPVNATAKQRMMENWAGRKTLCLYDNTLQNTQLIHFPSDHKLSARLLVHFYAFLFFEDWKQDLFMKRFVRDHVRYVDSIQCAAARVVEAVRQRARNNPKAPTNGDYDAFHIRRGDFQYTVTRFDAPKIYDMSKSKLHEGETIYIATDERDKAFFQPLRDKYDIVFLDDFHDVLGPEVNSNFFGMIDQLVVSRSRTFFGCWFSTFTGYIMRLRGYHSTQDKAPGYEKGIHNSWYYALEDRYDHIQTYYPVKQSYYAREFPTSWRLINTGIGQLD